MVKILAWFWLRRFTLDFKSVVIPANAGIQLKKLFTGCRVKPGMTKSLLT